MRTWSRRLAQLLLFAATLEVAARVDDALTHGASPWSRHGAEVLRFVDGEGIVRNVPGARFEKWRINALGFRGPEVAREPRPGVPRVVCLGQSESFGLYESPGEEWPAQLSRLLQPTHPGLEVINASVVGTGRSTRRAYVERSLLPLRPDVLVLLPSPFNEATETVRPAPPPRPGPAGQPPVLRAPPKLKLRLIGALPAALVERFRAAANARTLRKLEASELHGEPPLDRIPDQAVADHERHLREMVALLRARGVRPVLATYPTLVHPENLGALSHVLDAERIYRVWFSARGLIDAGERLNAATRRVAAGLHVPLADLDAAVPRDRTHFADDVHYTDAGAHVVAEVVAAALAAEVPGATASRSPP